MSQGQSSGKQRYADKYRTELERLIRVYEPENNLTAARLLELYAGMEHELVECYRHYYTGKDSFRVALANNQDATNSSHISSFKPLHLPTSAMGAYLRAKLQSRRSGAARNAKLEDIRGPTAVESPNWRRAVVVVHRRRSNSLSARQQHERGSNFEIDETEMLQHRRLGRSSS
ncbi:uncharacterized protein PHALS_12744 [Plasmopara halstedii]|uniref:Uncharacterized protein n=1 Tax=Plasmopara halstedii TaxID=4781 RepID=A0A0P1AN97_PLAHL|nr:uncharacterized protein PHALS_12744 [Plasmopara halstedii]CEG42472.1 hypothetical protein PHALS_12744 [Plasmopara halstedii]|eukprot:XP_024578841.1 hypothetical protein PHALS_12744 [Plasmopara halstedii]